MAVSLQDRISAGCLPLISLLFFYTHFWLYIPFVVIFFLAAKRFRLFHSKMTLLKVMDLWFSTFIYLILVAVAAVGVRIAVRDANTEIPFFSDDGFKSILILLGMSLSLLATILLSIAGFRGSSLEIPGIIRPFEYWSGRLRASSNQQVAQMHTDS